MFCHDGMAMTDLILCLWALPVAILLDLGFGEPPSWCHPVVAMGYFLKLFGRPMTRLPAGPALIAGCLAWSVGAALVVAVAIAVDRILQELAQDRLLTPGLGLPVAEFLLGILLKPLFFLAHAAR